MFLLFIDWEMGSKLFMLELSAFSGSIFCKGCRGAKGITDDAGSGGCEPYLDSRPCTFRRF